MLPLAIITAVCPLGKIVRSKPIIWSLSILIQWNELSNHWPHADNVYTLAEAGLFHFRQYAVRALISSRHFKGLVLHTLQKLELDHVLKNVILI